MNPSSWSRSTSSCSGMPAPGSMSTTLIPNALRPSPRRTSAHPPVRSNSSTCMIVNGSASGMVSLREDVGGPVRALPVRHRRVLVRAGHGARALDLLVVVDVGAGRAAVPVGGGREEHVEVLDEGLVALVDVVAHLHLVEPVGEPPAAERVLQVTVALVVQAGHGREPIPWRNAHSSAQRQDRRERARRVDLRASAPPRRARAAAPPGRRQRPRPRARADRPHPLRAGQPRDRPLGRSRHARGVLRPRAGGHQRAALDGAPAPPAGRARGRGAARREGAPAAGCDRHQAAGRRPDGRDRARRLRSRRAREVHPDGARQPPPPPPRVRRGLQGQGGRGGPGHRRRAPHRAGRGRARPGGLRDLAAARRPHGRGAQADRVRAAARGRLTQAANLARISGSSPVLHVPSPQEVVPMKKWLLTCGLLVAAIAPAAASATDPAPSDFKNAAHYCKALKKASGSNFASMFGSRKNAYGKCVSSTAKKQADKDEQQSEEAKTNAAKECKAERGDAGFAAAHGGKTFEQFYGTNKNGKNAYGKCVSTRARQAKAKADDEDAARQDDRVNAAKQCKAAKKSDPGKFGKDYGTRRNAFGKCVSRTAKTLAGERKD